MSDESGSSPISRVIDLIKDILDRIKTLLIAVGALIAAAVPIYKFVIPDKGTPPAPPSTMHATNCYDLNVSPHEDRISISRAKSRDLSWFDIDFKNGCQYDLLVRVEFKSVGDGIAIPPMDWPAYKIRPGDELRKKVNPPKVDVLTETPQIIQILVSIYREDNQELLHKDTFQIAMVE